MPVQMLMLSVVGCGDLSQKTCHHLDDIGDWHGADHILESHFIVSTTRSPRWGTRLEKKLFTRKALDVRKIADINAIRV